MNDTQKAIDAYLKAEKITFATRCVGETIRDNNWRCDAWRVSFAVGESSDGYKLPGFTGKTARFETDYFTGLGHRKQIKPMPRPPYRKNTLAYASWEKDAFRPVQPCAANVLYSLIQDSSAIDTSFEYWCSDYGYDSDSISAFNTYQTCCKIAKEMRQVFNHVQIETLRGMLEDY